MKKMTLLFSMKTNLYFEDFETGNIEYTDEILSFRFGIECLISTFDQPDKHAEVDLINTKNNSIDQTQMNISDVLILIEHQSSSRLDLCFDLC